MRDTYPPEGTQKPGPLIEVDLPGQLISQTLQLARSPLIYSQRAGVIGRTGVIDLKGIRSPQCFHPSSIIGKGGIPKRPIASLIFKLRIGWSEGSQYQAVQEWLLHTDSEGKGKHFCEECLPCACVLSASVTSLSISVSRPA